jgi:hypothetical protein
VPKTVVWKDAQQQHKAVMDSRSSDPQAKRGQQSRSPGLACPRPCEWSRGIVERRRAWQLIRQDGSTHFSYGLRRFYWGPQENIPKIKDSHIPRMEPTSASTYT